ncbi:DivIVA domain-containing protein [Collinsella tanakaei]|uniref:DivIVA domain-containing protein n=1 Tax=Collinsella tanakaei TaxID=626935 RepID=UPI001955FC6C|nr:DivIVA domain-containing protein [Collinsella tanakaei]MBM6755241.1 DivIVA domain-containing protein [Collinsella tanakaei]MBM6868023.1 DivIVA domain-containing protein [Collinsella tanakaei]
MAITPADIQAQTFSEAKRGYDPGEVDVFLEQVSAEVDAMLNKIVDLKNRLTATEQQLADAQAALAAKPEPAPAPAPAPAPEYSASERQISAALIAAQQTADNIVAEARENAERIRNEADAKAREVIRQALAEKQNEIEEIDRLKASREEFKSEYLKLIQHFMDDAQNSFPNDLLSSTPSGSAAAPAVDPAPVAAAPVADPFAPVDDFGMDDLD